MRHHPVPTRVAVQEYLFDAFIPAAYRPHPDRARRCPWSPKQAERWLVFLARHLEHNRHGTTDFAWWELRHAVPGARIGIVAGIVAGIVVGLMAGVMAGIGSGLAISIMGGTVGGAAQLSSTPAKGIRLSRPEPTTLKLGLILALVSGLVAGIGVAITNELMAGIMVGIGTALLSGLMTVLLPVTTGMPADLTLAAEPRAALVRDRSTSWALGLVGGLVGGLVMGLVLGLVLGLTLGLVTGFGDGLRLGLEIGLAIGLLIGVSFVPLKTVTETAWPAYFLARCWLALHHRLPWRLMRFLTDAHWQRGVLRQAGTVYQFRHADLQHRLATRPGA
jgi:hypothetical protein